LDEKALKERDYLVVLCILIDNENEISSYAIINNSATAYTFIDEDYTRYKNLSLYKLKEPRRLKIFNGTLTTSGDIIHITKVQMKIGQHTKALFLFVTKLEHYSVILEHPWLKHHDIRIGFKSSTVMFDSDFCMKHCLKEPVVVKGITSPIPELRSMITLIEGAAFSRMTTKARRRHHVETVGTFTVYDLRTTLKAFAIQYSGEGLSADVFDEDIRRKILAELYDLVYVFWKTLVENLSSHRSYDLKIELKDGFELSFGPLYKLSRNELETL